MVALIKGEIKSLCLFPYHFDIKLDSIVIDNSLQTHTHQLYSQALVTMVASDPSQSGQTIFIKSLIERAQIDSLPTPEQILFYYSMEQDDYKDVQGKHP